ncbi:MAG: Rieske 2Fe-2S domain-containing protein [Candidatus Eisenbacteria bacterium]|nr:Rieske 2Fe-2S domain-containing protein [Candidatus Latescibacterota bacterium]MBD3302713.1 Rieske 2Fe-2S domain-containing protein [Candidatus Eisenbacteria bacterium]
MPRRRFLDRLLGVSVVGLATAVVYPIVRYLSPPEVPEAASNRVLAAKVSELEQSPAKIFPFGSEAGILIRSPDGEYRAFAATCTHLECTVQFHEPSKRIWCACHNGWYDMNGRNVAGPPPKPLERYTVQVEGDEIFVSRS